MGLRIDPDTLEHWRARGLVTADELPRPPAVVADDSDRQAERDFMASVIAFAHRHGWRVYHTRDSRRSASGWPDLVLVRERVVFAELKTATGKLTADQQTWIEALKEAGQEVYLWRPVDWNTISRVLGVVCESSGQIQTTAPKRATGQR